MPSPTRRQVLKTAAAAAAVATLPRAVLAGETTGKRFIVNDASRLNPTPVYRHWIVGADEQTFFIERLRRELKDAAAAKRPVAVAAARHTMGGQSIPREGTAITMQTFRCDPDTRAKTYIVDAGTRSPTAASSPARAPRTRSCSASPWAATDSSASSSSSRWIW